MKKILALVLALVLCLAVFAGCTPADNSSSEPGSSSAGEVSSDGPSESTTPVTIKTVSMFGGTDPATGAYKALVDSYNAADHNYTADDESATGTEEWEATVTADFNNGNIPDVIFYFNGAKAEALKGKVASIDEIRAVDSTYASNINADAINAMKESDGNAYAIPVKGFWEGLFVNTKIFADNNLELPTTWDKLIAACKALSAKDIIPIACGFKDEPHYLLELLVASAGGVEDHSANPTTVETIPESWILGLNALKELNDAGAFPKNAASYAHGDDAVPDVQKGKAAMIASGSWTCGALSKVEVDADGNFVKEIDPAVDGELPVEKQLANIFTAMPLPVMTGGKGENTIVAGFSSGFYITKQAFDDPAKQAACIEFVKHCTTNEAVAALLGGAAGAPAAPITTTSEVAKVIADGNAMAGAAKTDMPIDSRLKKAAWDSLWGAAIKIADGTSDAKTVLEAAIAFNA